MSTELMNPREYEDLLKKLRHLRAQEQSAEKTLTEIRIEKATLIKENIDRAAHGQKQGIYDAAGMTQGQVSSAVSVKNMLGNNRPADDLPSFTVLEQVAVKSVPDDVREAILARPDITKKEAKEMIKEAKGASTPSAPKRPDPYSMIERAAEMDMSGQRLLYGFLGTQLGSSHYATLGLLPSAHPAVVKATIRALQNLHHPDKGGDPVEFAKIQEAAEAIQAD